MAVSSDPAEIAAMGFDAFAAAVGAELLRWGGQRRNHRILRAIWAAAQVPGGVERNAPAALSGPGSPSVTGTAPSTRSPRSRPAWSRCSTPWASPSWSPPSPGCPPSGRRDPGRGRRPRPLRLRPHLGQTRRAVPARERVGHLRRHDQGLRAWPPRAAHRRLACRVGGSAPTTRSTPPAITTSPAGPPTPCTPARPAPPSPPPCCASCSSSSPGASPGIPAIAARRPYEGVVAQAA